MNNSADGRIRPLKSSTGGSARYKKTTGRGGAANATSSMPSLLGKSLAEDGIRSPVGRDIPSMPRNGQVKIFVTGRGGAGNATSAKAPKRHMSQSETHATLAAETELVQQRKREPALRPPLVTGRGGAGNFRKSKKDKSKSSLTLSQARRPSTSQTSSSMSTFALDTSTEASTSTLSRLRKVVLRKRRHSISDLFITEPQGTAPPSLSPEGSEIDDLPSISDLSFTDPMNHVVPESTFGALAEAHEGISSNRTISVFSKCYAGTPDPSFTRTDESHYRRRQPSAVAPFEEPPMPFYLIQKPPSSSRRSRRRSVGTKPAKESGSRPPNPSVWSDKYDSDKYDTSEPRTRPNSVLMLPQEQDAAPTSPLLPPPRFNTPASGSLSPHSPLPASSAQMVGHRTMLYPGLRERGGSPSSFSGSSYRPSTSGSAIETESERSEKLRGVVLWRSRTLATPISSIPDQHGAPFIPLEAIVNAPPRQTRTADAKITSTISAVDPPTRPIEIPDTPPQIPISIFVEPPPRRARTVDAKIAPTTSAVGSPTRRIKIPDTPPQIPISVFMDPQPRRHASLAPTLRSSSPASQYESFTPTFGTRPLPPLPAASRRTTYTSIAPSECTFSSPPTSPISPMEEGQ